MKKFVIIFCAVLVIQSVRCDDDESRIMELCKEEEKVSEKEIDDYVNQAGPIPQKVKCFVACVNEKKGFVVDNKLSVPGLEKYIETRTDDQQLRVALKDVVEECKSITDQDRCEAVVRIENCLKQALGENGV